MQEIKDTLISDDLYEQKFVCDLNTCKGACCVEGDSGAPLDVEECSILEDIYEEVKPYMSSEGIAEIDKKGVYLSTMQAIANFRKDIMCFEISSES